MKTYVTDEAVLVCEGTYRYEYLKGDNEQELEQKAQQWFNEHKPIISIVNEDWTLRHIREVLGVRGLEANNRPLIMDEGDEALVIRRYPVPPAQKTAKTAHETTARIREWGYGILKRISPESLSGGQP